MANHSDHELLDLEREDHAKRTKELISKLHRADAESDAEIARLRESNARLLKALKATLNDEVGAYQKAIAAIRAAEPEEAS